MYHWSLAYRDNPVHETAYLYQIYCMDVMGQELTSPAD